MAGLMQKSHIIGEGYGSCHRWQRGATAQVGSFSALKETWYYCAVCGAEFAHQYGVIPDIFAAIRRAGVAADCDARRRDSKARASREKAAAAGPSIQYRCLRCGAKGAMALEDIGPKGACRRIATCAPCGKRHDIW